MLPDFKNLDIRTFSMLLEKKYLTNSYKIYWLNAILDEIKKGNQEIKFLRLITRMVSKCWYSILKYKLNLGAQDKLSLLVTYIYENSDLTEKSHADDIINLIENSKDKKLIKLVRKFYKFVPYRLLSPFYYHEIQSIKESDRNNFIETQSQTNTKFYMIVNEKIIVKEEWFDYLYKNQKIVEGWIKNHLISFLQSRNPNVPAIVSKIEPPQNRNLTKSIKFWKTIWEYNNHLKNIYTNKYLEIEDFSIDHFIPWSFVMHDLLWNLVPVSRSINSSKNDRLPKLDKYFNDFAELQYLAFISSLKLKKEKWIEDYLYLNDLEFNLNFPKNIFINILENTINPLYQLALNQGFQVWTK